MPESLLYPNRRSTSSFGKAKSRARRLAATGASGRKPLTAGWKIIVLARIPMILNRNKEIRELEQRECWHRMTRELRKCWAMAMRYPTVPVAK